MNSTTNQLPDWKGILEEQLAKIDWKLLPIGADHYVFVNNIGKETDIQFYCDRIMIQTNKIFGQDDSYPGFVHFGWIFFYLTDLDFKVHDGNDNTALSFVGNKNANIFMTLKKIDTEKVHEPDNETIKIAQQLLAIPDLHRKAIDHVFETGMVSKDGLWLEFGAYDGRSTKRIAAWAPEKTVYGFDSFEGLPEYWTGRIEGVFPKGAFTLGGQVPVPEQPNIEFIKGWFKDSIPAFLELHEKFNQRRKEPVSFIHLDSDIYSSAKDIFDNLATRIAPGCIIVFDELLGYTNYEAHEWKAWWEFVKAHQIKFEWIGGNQSRELKEFPVPEGSKKFQYDVDAHVSPAYENAAVKIIENPTFLPH